MAKKAWNLEELLEYTTYQDDCMLWKGGKHRQGYAMIRKDGKMRTVHSIIAEMKYGYTPDKYSGQRVTRTCDNLHCINPDHIIISNTADIERKRYHCKSRKITQEQAREIRKRYAEGGWGIGKKLAKEYGVTSNTIYATVANKLYKEIPDET